MAQIKIISDPYRKDTSFLCREDGDSSWVPVNPRSKLLGEDVRGAFFPFKAKDVIDLIKKEFWVEDQPCAIIFEGVGDEYKELESIVASEAFSGIFELRRSGTTLPNARDILPEIIRIFQELKPFLEENISDKSKIEGDLKRFSDASSDSIPICVMGTYSSGKSTFINALIGGELLPSADDPVTAFVYQVKRSRHSDRGRIAFSYDGEDISLRFDERGFTGSHGPEESPILKALREVFAHTKRQLFDQMRAALQVINDYMTSDGRRLVSDLVEVEVPFSSMDAWGRSSEFVIFDTPGSNNHTDIDHLRVLKNAMAGMSNGLPVFVTVYDRLSTDDDVALCDQLKSLDTLDSRFAMIVVNKADAASIKRDDLTEDLERPSEAFEMAMLRQAIPAYLYSQGIYFVSSIIGLGAKTRGDLIDDNYAEKFEDQHRKYSDPDNRFYKMLYRYNIMPEQIRERSVSGSLSCPNLMLANSGLYAVELAMEAFASRYSSYNKCFQSQQFLDRLINVTSADLDHARQEREKSRQQRNEVLEEDKRRLIEALDDEDAALRREARGAYDDAVEPTANSNRWLLSVARLYEEKDMLLDEERSKDGYLDASDLAEDTAGAILENLGDRFEEVKHKLDGESTVGMIRGLFDDARDAREARSRLRTLDKETERTADSRLIDEVEGWLKEAASDCKEAVDSTSRDYWMGIAQHCRDELLLTVTGAESIDPEMREELTTIIADFRPLEAELPRGQFDWERLHGLWLGNFRVLNSERLNIEKVAQIFNNTMLEFVWKDVYPAVKDSHQRSFDAWIDELMSLLRANIVKYNPQLRVQQSIIDEETKRIESLESGMALLRGYRDEVTRMMEWSEGDEVYGY